MSVQLQQPPAVLNGARKTGSDASSPLSLIGQIVLEYTKAASPAVIRLDHSRAPRFEGKSIREIFGISDELQLPGATILEAARHRCIVSIYPEGNKSQLLFQRELSLRDLSYRRIRTIAASQIAGNKVSRSVDLQWILQQAHHGWRFNSELDQTAIALDMYALMPPSFWQELGRTNPLKGSVLTYLAPGIDIPRVWQADSLDTRDTWYKVMSSEVYKTCR